MLVNLKFIFSIVNTFSNYIRWTILYLFIINQMTNLQLIYHFRTLSIIEKSTFILQLALQYYQRFIMFIFFRCYYLFKALNFYLLSIHFSHIRIGNLTSLYYDSIASPLPSQILYFLPTTFQFTRLLEASISSHS